MHPQLLRRLQPPPAARTEMKATKMTMTTIVGGTRMGGERSVGVGAYRRV